MNPENILNYLGFERHPEWDGEVFKEYKLERNGVIFRSHPVYCNKPDYITAGIISKSNKVKAWYDFTTEESFRLFLINNVITQDYCKNNSFLNDLINPFSITYVG